MGKKRMVIIGPENVREVLGDEKMEILLDFLDLLAENDIELEITYRVISDEHQSSSSDQPEKSQ